MKACSRCSWVIPPTASGRDRAGTRPGHDPGNQRHAGDMHRRPEAAEPEGVEQGDRLDQENQRVARLREYQKGASSSRPSSNAVLSSPRAGARLQSGHRQPVRQASRPGRGLTISTHRHAVRVRIHGGRGFADGGKIIAHHRRDQQGRKGSGAGQRPFRPTQETRQIRGTMRGHVTGFASPPPAERERDRDLEDIWQMRTPARSAMAAGQPRLGCKAGQRTQGQGTAIHSQAARATGTPRRRALGSHTGVTVSPGAGQQQAEAGQWQESPSLPAARRSPFAAIDRGSGDVRSLRALPSGGATDAPAPLPIGGCALPIGRNQGAAGRTSSSTPTRISGIAPDVRVLAAPPPFCVMV